MRSRLPTHPLSPLLTTLLLLVSCGGDDGMTDPEPDPDPEPVPITSAGGTVTSPDGKATLVIPAGALAQPTVITIRSASPPASPDLIPGSAYTFEPDGLQFAVPATLTIRIDSVPAARAEASPFVWLHRREDGGWTTMRGSPFDEDNLIVTGEIDGFSDYAAAIAEFADALLELGQDIDALATDAVAEDVIEVMGEIAELLLASDDPAFQALAEPVLDGIVTTACNAYASAVGNARDAPLDDYGRMTRLLAPVFSWAAIVEYLDDGNACLESPLSIDQVVTLKLLAFVDFYLERLDIQELSSNFDALLTEADLVVSLRGDVSALGYPTYDQRLLDEAQHPLLDQMRQTAWTACRQDGDHRWLSKLLDADEAAQWIEQDIRYDLQECATRIEWSVVSEDADISEDGVLGDGSGPAQGTYTATAPGIGTGTFTLQGPVAALRCPDGSLESDELVVNLAGTEVHRRPATGGWFFPNPLELDAETVLETAQVDPLDPAIVPLEIVRESPGCTRYMQVPTYVLATIDLEYPAPLDYFADFSEAPGSEWSSLKRSTSPSGETFLGQFKDEDVYLTFESLRDHTEVTLELDLHIIGSWNGFNPGDENAADRVILAVVGGPTLLDTSFSNDDDDPQNFPDMLGGGVYTRGTGASAIEALGYPRDGSSWGDTTYSLSYTFPHTNGTLKILFRSNATGEAETIGLDNVRVRAR